MRWLTRQFPSATRRVSYHKYHSASCR